MFKNLVGLKFDFEKKDNSTERKLDILINLYLFKCFMTKNSLDLENYFKFYFNDKFEKKELDIDFEMKKMEISVNNENYNNYKCFSEKNNRIIVLNKKIPICIEFYDLKIHTINSFLEEKYFIDIDIFIFDIKNKLVKLLFLNKIKMKKKIFFDSYHLTYVDDNTIAYKLNNLNNILNLRICDFFLNSKIVNNINIKGVFFELNFIYSNTTDSKLEKLNFCFKDLFINNQ